MKKNPFTSLKTRLTLCIIMICMLTGSIAFIAVKKLATDIVDKEYIDKAEQVSEAMANTLDTDDAAELINMVMDVYYDHQNEVVFSTEWGSDEWNEYMANYESIEREPIFIKVQNLFRTYAEIYDVDCIYICVYKTAVKHGIYIVDSAYDDENCPPGCVDSFEDGIWPDENDMVIPATLTNEEIYGCRSGCGTKGDPEKGSLMIRTSRLLPGVLFQKQGAD